MPLCSRDCQGIGPAYSSKIVRNGVRVGDLRHFDYFQTRLRALVQYAERAHGNSLNVDVEKEIAYYASVRDLVCSCVLSVWPRLSR